ncbi:MAG: BMC domain-containing protein [Opitutales bacterium]|nr:BMC domain-containing protein [Opitutales bacterium]MBP3357529.1 BMC domain-containing protein [Opitutales bacterium]
MANAIGVLETKGMVALVKGVDAMLKAASVSLAGQYKDVGSAYMSASVVGDVASVKAAVEAGATAAAEIGTVVSVHVIARPHDNTAAVLSPKPAKK